MWFKERMSGLDIFRILCCIGALNYHVVDDVIIILQSAGGAGESIGGGISISFVLCF